MSKPTTGDRWNVPDNDKNSPTQLLVNGVPALATVNRRKKIENTGIYRVRPL